MTDLPKCVRCGHAFVRQRSWNICIDCICAGYRGYEPPTYFVSIEDASDEMDRGGFDVMAARRCYMLGKRRP